MVKDINLEILNYLEKSYVIEDKLFFSKYTKEHEWGVEIINWLLNIFNSDFDNTEKVLKNWALNKGLSEIEIYHAWKPVKLQTKWGTYTLGDLARSGVSNVDKHVINILIDNLSHEIDITILKDLKEQIKTIDEFLSLVKCIGYGATHLVYNPYTFEPEYYFTSLKYDEILNERQNNYIWQNNFRPTRVN